MSTGQEATAASDVAPEARLVYAGLGSRLGAFLIDILVSALWALPFRALFRAAAPDPLVLGPIRLSGLVVLAVFWAYLVVTTATTGGTLGKHSLRLRVVTSGFARPDWLTVLFREVVGRVIVTASFGIGYLWTAVDQRKQGWHDKIADTFVLKRVAIATDTDPWTDVVRQPRQTGRHRPST